MQRQEYLQALVPAVIAWRAALRKSTLITVPINAGFIVWMFHLIKTRDPTLELKLGIGFLIVTMAMAATMSYMGTTFAKYSPSCGECGKHVRLLQRRRVWTTRKCAYCSAEMFEA